MENGNELPIAIGIKIDMKQVKVSKRHVDDARLDYLTGYEESTKKFGKKFVKESCDEEFDRYYERMKKIFRYDSGIHIRLRDNEDGSETIEVTFDDRFNWDDDVVSGRIPLDEDYLLLDWITRLDEAGHRNGWKFDYEIADDIEHPIDGGANNDYLAMLTLTCKCDKEEDDLLFENSSESTDDMEKEFTYKGVTITRYDYESLPSPMAASKLPDEQMQEIAKDIYFELVNRGWDEKEIQKYVNNVDDYELSDAEMRIADKIRSDWWATMEDVGRFHGMEYYEDLPEEGENYTESKKPRFGKKFNEGFLEDRLGMHDVELGREEPEPEWKKGEIVDIDSWQVMWEYDDEERLPEKGWKIVNIERDENYDDCDGYCYTIVNIRNPKLKVDVSASALVERKSGRKFKKSTKKFHKMEESINWDGVADKFLDNDKVQFTRKCPSCGKPHSITVDIRDVEDGCSKYGKGARIQDAFPNFSPDEREFFMTGICPDCWENM